MIDIPSPAVAIVGRHNSGKTTLVVALVEALSDRGLDVGTVKHHHHDRFEIDIPGKDSWRHRHAGATETVIACPGQVARVKSIAGELECAEIVRTMPGHDIVIVEGYRKSGLPTIEVMRQANDADAQVAAAFAKGAREGAPLGTDFVQQARGDRAFCPDADAALSDDAAVRARKDLTSKMPTATTVALVTDIPDAQEAAAVYGIPAFALDDTAALCDFLEEYYVRPKITVVIQAGGESRRMGQSKALVPFAGRPLMCRMVERLAPVADELVITTNESERLAFLHDDYPGIDIKLVPDRHDFRGALPGLHTALEAARHPLVAVVACDMLFASPRLVVAEALAMKESKADIVVPVNKHGFEPFHALYRRETCLPAVAATIAQGDRRAQSFFDKVAVREFPQEEVLRAEPMGGCFINANTPDELRAWEEAFLEE